MSLTSFSQGLLRVPVICLRLLARWDIVRNTDMANIIISPSESSGTGTAGADIIIAQSATTAD